MNKKPIRRARNFRQRNALAQENLKILDSLIDAGSRVRSDKDLHKFVDYVLKKQPKKDR